MFEIQRQDGWAVLKLRDDVDIASAEAIRTAIIDLAQQDCPAIAMDLSRVEFMDSTGLSLILVGLKEAQSHRGCLIIVNAPESCLRVLEMSGVSRLVQVFSALPAAGGRLQDQLESADPRSAG